MTMGKKLATGQKAGMTPQPTVRTQDRTEGLDGDEVVHGSVPPVHGPFRVVPRGVIDAIGCLREVREGSLDGPPGQVRFLFVDHQGPRHQTGMAHLGPIGVSLDPMEIPRTGLDKGRLNALGGDGCTDLLPFLGRQQVVAPVVAQGGGQGHFPDIQVVTGVPVLETDNRHQVATGGFTSGLIPQQPVGTR